MDVTTVQTHTHDTEGGGVSDQRHPYAGHPAALILADHVFCGNPNRSYGGRCSCWHRNPETGWRGHAADHPAHQTEVLHRAGQLADGPPPETPTARVLAERADRRTT